MAVQDFSRIEGSSSSSDKLALKTKWWKLCFYASLPALIVFITVLGALIKPSVWMSLIALVLAYYVAAYGYALLKVWIAGCQVMISKEGLFLAQFGKINWLSIVGIHLRTIDSRSQTKVLFLAIADIESYRHFTQPVWKKLLLQGIGFHQKKSVIRVPLIFPKGDPDAFVKAAKVAADRYGGQRYDAWYEEMPIQEAIEGNALEVEERELFSKLDFEQNSVFRFLKSAELRALDPRAQEALTEERMKSLNALASKQNLVIERRLKHSKASFGRKEKTAKEIVRKLKWANYIYISLFATWIISLILKHAR